MSENDAFYPSLQPDSMYFRLRRPNGQLEEYRYDSWEWSSVDNQEIYRGVRLVRRWATIR